MAYQLDRFNGTFLVSVEDQTVNNTATDLRFVGRNYSGYGEITNENLLHLLENFANTTAPPRAIAGQLWFDTATKKLKVYDGAKFKATGGAESSATAPIGPTTGEFWFDTQNQQLFVYTGTGYVLVGPEKAPVYGDTAAAPAVIKDSVGTDQQIVKFTVGGEVIAIVSKNEFIISPLINPIPGFSLLKPGINFINSPSNGITTSAHRFWGTAANSDRLQGFAATDFLRSTNTVFATQASFKDPGYVLGDQNDFRLRIINGDTPVIESTLNKPMILRISNNEANIEDVVVIKPTGIEPGTTNLYDLGTLTARWRNFFAETARANTFTGSFIGQLDSGTPGTPLTFKLVNITEGLTMTNNAAGTATNVTVNLAGSNSIINLTSGQRGSLNNFNIGATTPGTGKFTDFETTGTIRVTSTTESTSITTGSVVISGGVAIQGNLRVAGNGIYTGAGGLKVPSGATNVRPAAPLAGMIRFNTTLGEWEGYDGNQWRGLAEGADEDLGLITSPNTATVDYGTLL